MWCLLSPPTDNWEHKYWTGYHYSLSTCHQNTWIQNDSFNVSPINTFFTLLKSIISRSVLIRIDISFPSIKTWGWLRIETDLDPPWVNLRVSILLWFAIKLCLFSSDCDNDEHRKCPLYNMSKGVIVLGCGQLDHNCSAQLSITFCAKTLNNFNCRISRLAALVWASRKGKLL